MNISKHTVLRLIQVAPMTSKQISHALGVPLKRIQYHLTTLCKDELVTTLKSKEGRVYCVFTEEEKEEESKPTIPGARVFACRHTQGNGRYFLPNVDGFGL